MTIITCPDCGFTADAEMFTIEAIEQGLGASTYEAECPECGNWSVVGWDYAVSLFN